MYSLGSSSAKLGEDYRTSPSQVKFVDRKVSFCGSHTLLSLFTNIWLPYPASQVWSSSVHNFSSACRSVLTMLLHDVTRFLLGRCATRVTSWRIYPHTMNACRRRSGRMHPSNRDFTAWCAQNLSAPSRIGILVAATISFTSSQPEASWPISLLQSGLFVYVTQSKSGTNIRVDLYVRVIFDIVRWYTRFILHIGTNI